MILPEVRDLEGLKAVPGFLASDAGHDTVNLHVTYDDGTIQTWADRMFGPGVVVVTQALVDAG